MAEEIHVVTGAFSYTGKYLARILLARGVTVRTITGHPDRPDPFGGRVAAFPFDFDRPDRLVATLRGVSVLYNTYWVRFDHGGEGYPRAVRNTRLLFRAAREAGVRRIVHVSIANPSIDSPLPYYAGKARLEEDLAGLGIPHAVVRPAVIFGDEDILIHNIAWFLRRFPAFAVPGSGRYGMQPIFVEELATLLDRAGRGELDGTFDAAGPEKFTFEEWVRFLRDEIGGRARIVHAPPEVVYALLHPMGLLMGDVILTRQEIAGLMADLLVSHEPPRGTRSFRAWIRERRDVLGRRYSNEIRRHFADRRP